MPESRLTAESAYRLKRGGGALYSWRMILRILTAIIRSFVGLGLLFSIIAPSAAQNRDVPYWASINTEELNMRVGPSMEYRIDWVYRSNGLPVKVIRAVGQWWLIEDSEGTRGWVSKDLLSLRRSAVVIGAGLAAMREMPSSGGKLKWNAQPGVVGELGDCDDGWCEFDVAGRVGWIEQGRIWGAGKP